MNTQLASAMKRPEGVVDALVQYNKITGVVVNVLTGVADSSTLNQTWGYQPIKINLNEQVVVGVYPNFRVVSQSDQKPTFYEEGMNSLARSKITKEYPLIAQINILSDAITSMCEKLGIDDTPEVAALREMRSYIRDVLDANATRKSAYAADPSITYVSKEEQERINSAQLEGGAHEALGPRESADLRIY